MSKISVYGRPIVFFDADNKNHRNYYYQFLKTGSWKDCPYRWAIMGEEGNLQGQIQRTLLERYLGREFKSTVKNPEILVRQNRNKSVDKL